MGSKSKEQTNHKEWFCANCPLCFFTLCTKIKLWFIWKNLQGGDCVNKAQLVFKAVDIIGDPLQNNFHFENVLSVRDIAYGSEKLNKGDLYYIPEILGDGKKHPVIVYYHGGAFLAGDKKYRVSICEYYAKEGYFVFCPNYRMPPEVDYKGLMRDCVDSLNFVQALAEKYNIDLENVVLTGDSAGGYIASYLAAIKYNEMLCDVIGCNKVNADLKGLMLMCGIYDLEVLMKGTSLMGVIPTTARTLLNFNFKNDFSNIKDFPDYEYISPASFVNDKWCSTFICWADDDLVCQGQGEPMAEKLKAVVPLYDQYHVAGIQNNHCFHLTPSINKYAKECLQKSLDFLVALFAEEKVTV